MSRIFISNVAPQATHYQRTNMTQLQEDGTGEEVSEILFFSAKSKRRPSLIYSMQIIPVCLSIVAHDEKEFLQPDEVGQTGRRFPSYWVILASFSTPGRTS